MPWISSDLDSLKVRGVEKWKQVQRAWRLKVKLITSYNEKDAQNKTQLFYIYKESCWKIYTQWYTHKGMWAQTKACTNYLVRQSFYLSLNEKCSFGPLSCY
jgi:hypothetical protein